MKRTKILLASFLILNLCMSLFGVAVAREASSSANILALDVVIVIDQSTSMYSLSRSNNSVSGNDRNGYRLEAASMMLGMCDVERSRAAIVPFAKDLMIKGRNTTTGKLLDISMLGNNNNRSAMIKELSGMNGGTKGDTNIGLALEYAVELLTGPAFEDRGNRPVILLLTDGQLSLSKDDNSKAEDPAKMEVSREQMAAATEKAKENGIAIHTMALLGSSSFDTSELAEIAKKTGGIFSSVKNSNDLPTSFNEIFAHEIGSDVASLQGEMMAIGNGQYRLDIEIPNRSVVEANIMIENSALLLDARRKAAVMDLYAPDSSQTPVQPNGKDVIRVDTNYFTFFKIVRPQNVGKWSILMSERRPGVTVNAAAINVVFSYEMKLEANIKKGEMYKSDTLSFDAVFMQEGQKSPDEALYRSGNPLDPNVMTAQYSITKEGKQYNAGTMDVIEGEKFTFNKPLAEVDIQNGGQYLLTVTVQGAGLLRTVEVPFTVTNHAPEVKANVAPIVIAIDDPTENSLAANLKQTVQLEDIFSDADGEYDSLHFDFVSDYNAGLVAVKGDGSSLTIAPQVSEMAGDEASASTEITVRCRDNDGEEVTTTIPVTVRSLRNEFKKTYAATLSAPDANVKGKDIRLMLQWRKTDGTEENASDAIYEHSKASVNYWYNGEEQPTLTFVSATDDNGKMALVGVLPAKTSEGSYTFAEGMMTYADYTQQLSFADIHIGNFQPIWNADKEPFVRYTDDEAFEAVVYCGAVISGMETNTPTEQLTVNLNDYFYDADDGPDTLIYRASYQLEGDERALPVPIKADGGVVTLPVAEMDVSTILKPSTAYVLHFAAEDGEYAKSEPHELRLSVTNYLKRDVFYALCALAAALALFILLKLIRWLLKPVFARGMGVESSVVGYAAGNSLLIPFPRSKKEFSLLSYSDQVCVDQSGIATGLLDAIKVWPHNASSVYIMVDKKKKEHASNLSGASITYGNDPSSAATVSLRKKQNWRVDESLFIQVGEESGKIQLTLVRGAAGDMDDAAFGSNDQGDWTSGGSDYTSMDFDNTSAGSSANGNASSGSDWGDGEF